MGLSTTIIGKLHVHHLPRIFLLGAAACSASAWAQESGTSPEESSRLEEIVVTAQRREQSLADVPISVTALSRDRMDQQGVRRIDDIARLTPGISFARADARNGQAATISIRGISSGAGASTTGIYIDDTPIQIRSLGYSSFNTFPAVFDVERVEVLRGPQGTLFGAGSEGGTVRFITPEPNLQETSAYVRSEIASTQHGDETYEGGAAIGGPIVANRIGYRVSGWYRRDGGYVDRTDWDRTTRTATTTIEENANWQDSYVGRAALAFAPTEGLRITPSVYYQRLKANDSPNYWRTLSDPGEGEFFNGNSLRQQSVDRFYLPALKVEWELGRLSLVSNTSYFNRHNEATNDYSAFEAGLWTGNPFFPAGFFAPTRQVNDQSNITQEFRLQSNQDDARLNWVVGAFYSHSRQTAKQFVQDTFLPGLYSAITGCSFTDPPPPRIPPLPNSCPPAAGFGQPLADGLYTFVADPIIARDDQMALFTQLDYALTDKLTLIAGLRMSKTEVEATADYRGPVVGPPVSDSGSQEEEPITPKFGISYDINDDNMVYATAAKGFRIGGYNPRVGLPCAPFLTALGLFDSTGAPAAPTLFSSDTVWSYELGSKNTLADGRVQLSSSVYFIDWEDIQQGIALQCGFTFVANLGSATSKGFDVDAQFDLTSNLRFGLSVGYGEAEYDETVRGGPAATNNLVTDGDRIPGSPWSGSAYTQLAFTAFGERKGYARLDYQYSARQDGVIGANNPSNGSFNPNAVFIPPRTSVLSMRAGVNWSSGLELAAFVNNVTDSQPTLTQALSGGLGPVMPSLYQHTTLRPRTFGLTMTYRY
jgi:iron complex outermembrane receptor protein